MKHWQAGLAALLAGFATALLMGCGINTKDAGKPNPKATTSTAATTPSTTSTINTTAATKLPKRPAGTVAVDGPIQGSITPKVSVPGVSVAFHNGGESEGFGDLCAGRIDVLDTSRIITKAELRTCNRNGLDLIEPIQVASDAVVIATRNESDVGGDCLRLSTVNDIFRAGSPITDWSQVGFFSIPLRVTGREANSPAFQFFAQSVLGVASNATLSDVRDDYVLRTTDRGVRREVTSEARVARVNAKYKARIDELGLERGIALQDAINRAIGRAHDRMLAIFAREDKRRAASKVTLTPTQKLLIRRNNLRRINAAQRAAQNRAIARFQFPQLTFLRARYHRALKAARLSGTIGIFRFSYYELYENALRPMEIWDPDRAAAALDSMTGVKVVRGTNPAAVTTTTETTTTDTTATTGTTTTSTTAKSDDGDIVVDPDITPWCVFPSQTTITNGSYPLSRPIYLYVSKLNLKRPEVQSFLTTYVNNAQQLATNNRLVPIPQTLVDDNLARIQGKPLPSATTTTTTTSTTPTTSTTATFPSGSVPGVANPGTTTPTNPGVAPGTTTTP